MSNKAIAQRLYLSPRTVGGHLCRAKLEVAVRAALRDAPHAARRRLHPADRLSGRAVALWKRRKAGEPYCESSLGQGRPGWHIEDTAITETLFGPQYDIHGGAIDLIFPHHEAEIAQMESISRRAPLARYWLHTGFLTLRDAKMSKSARNVVTIRRVLGETSPEVLRFFLISHQYRSPMEFDSALVRSAASALKRLRTFYVRLPDGEEPGPHGREVQDVREAVLGALDDDSTPQPRSRSCFSSSGSGAIGCRERRFAEADEIRKRLRELRIVVEDTGASSRWYRQVGCERRPLLPSRR